MTEQEATNAFKTILDGTDAESDKPQIDEGVLPNEEEVTESFRRILTPEQQMKSPKFMDGVFRLIPHWWESSKDAIAGVPKLPGMLKDIVSDIVALAQKPELFPKYFEAKWAGNKHGMDSDEYKAIKEEIDKIMSDAAPTIEMIVEDITSKYESEEALAKAWAERPFDIISDLIPAAGHALRGVGLGKVAKFVDVADPGNAGEKLVLLTKGVGKTLDSTLTPRRSKLRADSADLLESAGKTNPDDVPAALLTNNQVTLRRTQNILEGDNIEAKATLRKQIENVEAGIEKGKTGALGRSNAGFLDGEFSDNRLSKIMSETYDTSSNIPVPLNKIHAAAAYGEAQQAFIDPKIISKKDFDDFIKKIREYDPDGNDPDGKVREKKVRQVRNIAIAGIINEAEGGSLSNVLKRIDDVDDKILESYTGGKKKAQALRNLAELEDRLSKIKETGGKVEHSDLKKIFDYAAVLGSGVYGTVEGGWSIGLFSGIAGYGIRRLTQKIGDANVHRLVNGRIGRKWLLEGFGSKFIDKLPGGRGLVNDYLDSRYSPKIAEKIKNTLPPDSVVKIWFLEHEGVVIDISRLLQSPVRFDDDDD